MDNTIPMWMIIDVMLGIEHEEAESIIKAYLPGFNVQIPNVVTPEDANKILRNWFEHKEKLRKAK